MAIGYYTIEGKIISYNEQALANMKLRKEDIVGKSIFDIFQKEDADFYMGRIREALSSTGSIEYEDFIHLPSGAKWYSSTFRKICDLNNDPIGIQIISKDITDRKLAEEALRESEARFRTLSEMSPIAIYETDAYGNCLYVNRMWRKFSGLSLEEALGEGWKRGLHPDDRERIFALWYKHAKDRDPWSFEYRFQATGEEVTWVYGTASAQWDKDNKITGYIGTNVDITARKHAEAERDRMEAQLLQAQKMEAVGRLAGGVAHDFNNILTVINGRAEIALMSLEPNDPHCEAFEEIHQSGERAANLTRQLLAFARKQTVAPRVLDLNETVEGMMKMLRRLIGEDVDLSWNPGRDLLQINIDPAQIDQILVNLCVNARDAISDVGKITIETRNVVFDEGYCAGHAGFIPGEYVMLAVSDNGCGMDKETLSKVFDPFFTTKELGKGTGLGLATVYGIIKQNNGYINVCSEVGKGTTFKIYLPKYGEESSHTVLNDTNKTFAVGMETILLVEDEPAILKLGKTIFGKMGYTVLAASTPGEAIRIADEFQGQIQLLVTDVVMPEMNGRDLAEKLLSRYPHLKRLFMSGYTADVIAQHGVLDEGIHFIQKPFSIKDMAAKVRDVLEQ